ncbi:MULTISPECIES: fimbrial protein [unclassified Achromobacter]|uniref:fimbrial protein n=1 Tax=unclassified Achromobacter TaxID=2626865 RepID=UPI001E4C9541|nr:fimbrial protein [Achromobacter sp. MY14]
MSAKEINMGKRRMRHPKGWRAGVAMLAMLAAPQWASAADDVFAAAECEEFPGLAGSGWSEVEPLTTQSQVGQVLFERQAPIAIRLKPVKLPGAQEKHKLFGTAAWRNPVNMVNNIVNTNVDGIGLKILFQDTEVSSASMSLVMDAQDIIPRHGVLLQFAYFAYVQQLVLMAKPEDLPRNLNVTGVPPNTAMVLGFFTERAGLTAPGQIGVGIPSWQNPPPTDPPGAKLCGMTSVYQGSKIFSMGTNAGAQSITIKHQCDAGAHQNIPVHMLPAFVADFPAEGAMSAPRPFNIRLNQCSALARPQVKFRAKSGLVAGTDTVLALYGRNANGDRPARGIGVIVVDEQDQRVRFGPVGGAYGPNYAMTPLDGGAQLSLAARYIRTAVGRDDLEGGVANAAAEFTFEFP